MKLGAGTAGLATLRPWRGGSAPATPPQENKTKTFL